MIYTSYFAKIKTFPSNFIPIAICAKLPNWYAGLHYDKLAPGYHALMQYKQSGDFTVFTQQFRNQVLSNLAVDEVLDDFASLAIEAGATAESQICLVCYEKSTDNCHRHLVAEWLQENNIDCQEWCG